MIGGSGGCWAEWIMLFVRAQTTQVPQLLSVRACLQKTKCEKLCARSAALLDYLIGGHSIRPVALLEVVVNVVNLAASFIVTEVLLGRF